MDRSILIDRVEALLDPVAVGNGFELVAVEIVGEAGTPIVRVYLDHPNGVNLDVIAQATTWVSSTLDEDDLFPGSFTLEVSSPGIDRPLRKIEDFDRFAGENAAIKTRPIDGRSSFKGRIVGVKGEAVELDVDGQNVHIPHGAIKSARLKVDIDFGSGDRE